MAVSGGGDSLALLHLAVEAGCTVAVATVDHGLRPEAADEAAAVGAACAALSVPHDILHWRWDGQGNLQDAARRGRIAALAAWAQGRGLRAVALGHTQDDIAETFLMRLARDAGVDGLAAMAARREVDGIAFLRPLLGVGRAELRGWLLQRGVSWADDPSNDDPRFDRVRARRALAAMADAGVDGAAIAALAGKMAEVRAALEATTAEAAARLVRIDGGDVILDTQGLAALPAEIRRRLLLAAVMWIASAEYGPRGAEMERFVAAALEGRVATLAGCRTSHARGRMRITREVRAVAGLSCPVGALWDRRWRVSGPDSNGLTLRALGEAGLAACPDWRAAPYPRTTLLASPAVWDAGVLVAAPLAGFGAGWVAQCQPPRGPLAAAPLSH
ncbi:tRNA lysidine(34) synthetase TilS [Paragemmobacter ruber]|uniref:tRNA lysidine(34) synthetase TilS n=1 Tax=Paragemmobacter ruber TaxID=1985673 RepID=UPI001F451447|nr:tRNA lysidine(34) synthetase TilS [Rhodobacter ruber]